MERRRGTRERKPKVHFDVSCDHHMYDLSVDIDELNVTFSFYPGGYFSLEVNEKGPPVQDNADSWACSSSWVSFPVTLHVRIAHMKCRFFNFHIFISYQSINIFPLLFWED